MTTKEIKTLLVSEIMADPNQPREYFDEAEIKALADSIRAEGQLTPILVVELPEDHPGRTRNYLYGVVCGERRLRAHQLIGKQEIFAEVSDSLDDKAKYRKQLLENAVRQDLKPVEFGKACLRGIEKLGMSYDELASAMGKSVDTIKKDISLTRLPPEIQTAVNSGTFPKKVAYRIAELEASQMVSAFTAATRKPKNSQDMLDAINAYVTAANQTKLVKSEEQKASETKVANDFFRWSKSTTKIVSDFTAKAESLADARKSQLPVDLEFWKSVKRMAEANLKAIGEKQAQIEHKKAVKVEEKAAEPVAEVVNG